MIRNSYAFSFFLLVVSLLFSCVDTRYLFCLICQSKIEYTFSAIMIIWTVLSRLLDNNDEFDVS